ncbi:MAG: hypothetical protein BWZ02_02837 [Lentisphaerae bacterium ADurb.BinA184]|nr:MAG: hypothetical protein BWZ02_02837 [Lentisphaerae bacterium ADurb.BinA184]
MNRRPRERFVSLRVGMEGGEADSERHLARHCTKWRILLLIVVVIVVAVCLWGASREAALVIP